MGNEERVVGLGLVGTSCRGRRLRPDDMESMLSSNGWGEAAAAGTVVDRMEAEAGSCGGLVPEFGSPSSSWRENEC